jgi:hypothetical protein
LFLSSSCQENKDKNEAFYSYIQQEFEEKKMLDRHLFFLLPDDACFGLVDTLIPYFNSLDANNFTIVLIGRSKKKLDVVSSGFKNREQIIYDTKGKAYDVNLIKPLTPTIYIKDANKIIKKEYPNIDLEKISNEINSFIDNSE